MYLRSLLAWLTRIIVPTAILSTTYLYLYPFWLGCAFSSTSGLTYHGFFNTVAQHAGRELHNDTSVAPLRLLVLADPQLEGDSSLPDPDDALLARSKVHWSRLRKTEISGLGHALAEITKELILEDIPRALWTARKTLDLFGNDYYLAHIYRTLHWWSKPTHVTVLGDLIGSQWVSDDEFDWRAWRYWNRMLAGSHPVEEETMNMHKLPKTEQVKEEIGSQDWSAKIINIAGNHDIGYAGDISRSRLNRFERAFGNVNWDIHFSYPVELVPENYHWAGSPTPTLHIVILNSMLLDTPCLDGSLQGETYNYINDLITNRLDPVEARNSTFTLLLTHVPLHKPDGICVDAPFFDFWDFRDADGAFKKGGLKEQNHLSEHVSHAGVLQSIFGMSGNLDAAAGGKGRNGLILTGHDHEGCDVVHYIQRTTSLPDTTEIVEHKPNASDTTEVPLGESQALSESNSIDSPSSELTTSWSWNTMQHNAFPKLLQPDIVTFLREITLRSMMGQYSGNAGLLSMWYDFEARTWQYEMQMCPLGVQHIWWAVHIIDIAAVGLLVAWLVLLIVAKRSKASGIEREGHKLKLEETAEATVREVDDRARKITRSEVLPLLVVPHLVNISTEPEHARSVSQRRRKG